MRGGWNASSTALRARLRDHAALDAAAPAGDAGRVRARPRRDGADVPHRAEGLRARFRRRRDPDEHPRGAGHVVLRDGGVRRRRSPTSLEQRSVHRSIRDGSGGGIELDEHGARSTSSSSRAPIGRSRPRRSSGRCGRSSRACPGFEAFPTLPPAINIGGRQSNSTYQLIVQSRRHRTSCTRGPRGSYRRSRRLPRGGRRQQRHRDEEPARQPGRSTATRRRRCS